MPLIPFTDTLKILSPFCEDNLKTFVSGSLALAPTALAGVAFQPGTQL